MCGIVDRFLAKVEKTDGCWLWSAGRNNKGYGLFWLNGKKTAHRVAFELFCGPIPDGLHVLHRCDNPACVRPDHLFVGTNQDNVDDKMQKGRFTYHSKGGGRGSCHVFAKLTDVQIEEIRASDGLTQKQLGEIYGVHNSQISRIRNNKAYRKNDPCVG